MLTCSQIDGACGKWDTGTGAAVGVFCGENKALLFREFRGRGVGVVGPEGGSEFSPRSGVPGVGYCPHIVLALEVVTSVDLIM